MIKVLIVDDSALVRKVISDIIRKTEGMMVIDTAHDPIFAIEKLKTHGADVIILDIEMPRMDGLTFLDKLMRIKPTPVIILSSLTAGNAKLTLKAFDLGAFDVLAKPEDLLDLPEMERTIVETIQNASSGAVKNKLKKTFENSNAGRKLPHTPKNLFTGISRTTDKIIAIGSSTGGTTAISEILRNLPVDMPGIVIVQHMPLKYTHTFAERLNNELPLTVKIAETEERILPGVVYIAPGDRHCSITASGAKYLLRLRDGPKVNYHKPSVTVLFNSVANFAGQNAVGIMLTGMGNDGAKAMKEMKDSGAYNIVQDEDSSIVWGMPGKAVEYGAASKVVPLHRIADELITFLQKTS